MIYKVSSRINKVDLNPSQVEAELHRHMLPTIFAEADVLGATLS